MSYKPTHLQPYERPSHYGGAHFEDYYTVYSVTRDSDTLARSNFQSIIRALGFESPTDVPNYDPWDESDGTAPEVIVTRASHWACGWIDTLRVRIDAPEAMLRTADEILAALEDYPIVDESDHSDLEWEEACDYWERMSVSERVNYITRANTYNAYTRVSHPIPVFAARRDELPEDPNGRLFELLTQV